MTLLIITLIIITTSCTNKAQNQSELAPVISSSKKKDTLPSPIIDTIYKSENIIVIGDTLKKIKIITDTNYKNNENEKVIVDAYDFKIVGEKDKHREVYLKKNIKSKFETYKVNLYKGKLPDPDFNTNPYDWAKAPEYIEFIQSGCDKIGVNFGGKYTILERECGMFCVHIFMIDRETGKILTDFTPFKDGRAGFKYFPDSKMIIANPAIFENSELENHKDFYLHGYEGLPEIYYLKDSILKRIE